VRQRNLSAYAVAGFAALIIGIGLTQFVDAQPEPADSATGDQEHALVAVFRRFERIMFDAMVTGDASEFPTVFYNDPTVTLSSEYVSLQTKHRPAVDAILEEARGRGPIGAQEGYLSAKIAEIVEYNEHANAWEEAKALALREQRRPTIQDLPNGMQPIERKLADQWVDVEVYIHDPLIQGEQALATFSFGTDKREGTLLHMTFTRIEGQWYVTSSRSEGDA
jgi:hypothetical protein